jgi:hypothetical protein
MMQQQTRRRRYQAGIRSSPGEARNNNTVLPLRVTHSDGGGHDKRVSSSSTKRRLFVFAIVIFGGVILLCFLLQIDPKLLFTTGDGNTKQVIRISSTENADMTEFIPCIDNVSIEPYLSKIETVLPDYRKKTRNPAYTSLPCAPPNPNHCFRGVYDGFDLLDLVKQHGDGNPENHNRIAILIESLISKPGVPLQRDDNQRDAKPELLAVSIHRQKTYLSEQKDNNQLHADYLESDNYVYTAILYDDTPDNLVGGETALANFRRDDNGQGDVVTFGMTLPTIDLLPSQQESKLEQSIDVTDGLIVEPKRGRLVLFSAGAENFHTPMVVRSGERPTYHFWYKCRV